MTYAGPEYWDGYFRKRRESGEDLDWGGQWTVPFLAPLRDAKARTILELGCGTGNDASRLAREGYVVTAVDVSAEAIDHAKAKFGTSISFVVADIAVRLPFRIGHFDAVMSNVALHMFSDAITRSIFAEVARVRAPEWIVSLSRQRVGGSVPEGPPPANCTRTGKRLCAGALRSNHALLF